MTEAKKPATILTFDNSQKEPREIECILPFPPSDGLMKEIEQGLVTKVTFALQLAVRSKGKSQEEVMSELENRRKL